MPSAKSGSPGSCVAPTAPTAATEADTADPGEMEELKTQQRSTKTGKYGSQEAKPIKKDDPKEKKPHYIEIELVDDAGDPVPGEPVEVEVPDGSVAYGTTDDKGLLRIDNIDSGNCKITFTQLDKDAWEPA